MSNLINAIALIRNNAGFFGTLKLDFKMHVRKNMNTYNGKSWRKLTYTNSDHVYFLQHQKRGMVNAGKETAKLKAIAYKHNNTQIAARGAAYDAVTDYLHRLEHGIWYVVGIQVEAGLEAIRNHKNNGDWEFVDLHELARGCNVTFNYDSINTLHNLHVSTEMPTQVAYYPSLRHWREDRPVRTSLGKYLTKYKELFGLSETDIKSMAEKHMTKINARAGWEMKFIEHNDPNGWLRVYSSNAVRSCMKGMDAVRVYAHEKSVLRLAYLQDGGGDIIARCIVRDDDEKGWLRVYPDQNGSTEGRFLLDSLKAAGYTENINLDGVLLDCIEQGSAYVCPYIDCGNDGDQTVDVIYRDGTHYLRVGNGDYDATNTDGYVGERCSCDECGDSYAQDDLTYIDSEDRSVCSYCRDQRYVYAYGRRNEEYYLADDCVVVDGNWYLMETANHHDIYQCSVTDDWFHQDYLYFFDEGIVHRDDAAHVDHEHDGDNYVHPDYVSTLSDGTTCHDDDADEYQAEIDEAADADTDEEESAPVKKSHRRALEVGDTVVVKRNDGALMYSVGDKGTILRVDMDNTVYVDFNNMGNSWVTGDGKWWLYKTKVERVTDNQTNVQLSDELYALAG